MLMSYISDEDVVFTIQDYAFDEILPQNSFRNRAYFRRQSYLLWAVDELINSIYEQRPKPAISVIREFAAKTERFKNIRNPKTYMMFKVAHDMVTDILDILR